jgi:hypothetical protein
MVLAQQNFGLNRTKTVTFREDVKIASEILPAGEYRVTHVMEGEKHIMLFKRGKDQFRVNCTMVELERKSPDTHFIYYNGPEGKLLTGMVFQGDNFRHEFAR